MPSTHTCLRYHIVFSTKERHDLIDLAWRGRMHAFLGKAVQTLGGVAMAVGGVGDHVHILASLKASHSVAEVVRDIKVASSKWVSDEFRLPVFGWQEGYGAFTVSPNQCDAVMKYILNQEEHHRARTLQEEYRDFLVKAGVAFDERFLW